MSKQTAINWLFKKLFDEPKDKLTWNAILEQAKEMEKQQMDKVAGDWFNEAESYMHDGKKKWDDFEDYYNQTFNK